MRFTIGIKLAAIAGVALVGVAALMLVNQHESSRVFESANYANVNTVPSFFDLDTAHMAMEGNRRRIWEHLALTDPGIQAALEREIAENDAKADKALDVYERNDISDDADRQLLQADRAALSEYRTLRDRVLALSRAGKKADGKELLVANFTTANKLSTTFTQHFQYKADLGRKSAAGALAVRSSSALVSALIGIVALGLIGGVAFLIGRGVLRSLTTCAKVADDVARGDLSVQIPEGAEDESGDLLRSLKHLVDNVRALVQDAERLSRSAVEGQFTIRADEGAHSGDFRKVVQGVNATLDVVVDKLEWYRSIIDAVPFPIHVIDNDMKWVFLNKAFETLMVQQGYVRDRQDAVGRPCSTANANICRTKNCGIEQLKVGVGQSFFDWCGMNCKQDTAYVLNAKGERVGFVETVTDLTSTLRVKHYTERQVDVVARNLERLSKGDLNLDYTLSPSDDYTKEVALQFSRINDSFMAVGEALTALSTDTHMLSSAATRGEMATRADVSKHEGDFRTIVQGVNATLDVVVDKLEWYRSIIDAVPFPIHVIDNDMKWVFLNKAFETLMVQQGYVRDRQDAVGRPCSTANANICRTKNCGIEQLKVGVGQSFFDWCGMNCKQDTAYVLNAKGERVGFVETVTDLTSTLRVKHYTERQVDVVARNLERLSKGDLNLDYTLSPSDDYTKEVALQFSRINDSFMGVGEALTSLSTDTHMLSSAATKGELSTRADAGRHQGDFRRIVQGVNDTLDAVIGPLNMAASHVDSISRGEIPPKITDSYQGDFNTIKNNLNQCIEGLQGLVESNQVLQQLAGNDFTARVRGQYLGIYAEVARALNETVENQARVLARVQESAYVVAQSSGEIATGNQELSTRTEQQASNLEETASSLEEFTSMVNQTAENARSASGAAAQARTVADEGSKAVEQLVESMDAINAASSKINEIISVVDEIAFQTNLLALNAAVEAARAGEQGRGFAVVATEVRNLAKRSADAAKEIKSLIKDSVTKAQDGQKVAARTGQIILDVVSNVQKVSEIMADIANATHEQTMGIGEINKAVTQMDETTQHNAALVEEAAASAENLDHQAQSLRQVVAQYRLGAAAEALPAVPAALPGAPPRPAIALRSGRSQERPAPPVAPRKRPGKAAPGKAAMEPPKGDEDDWESF